MTASRAVGGIGRAAVAAGVILLLFVAYQLWGTGLQHQLAQDDLEADFQAGLEAAAGIATTNATPASTSADASATAASGGDGRVALVESITLPASEVAGADNVTYSQDVLDLLPILYPGSGEASARIRIPAIGLDEIVVFGVDADDLRKGPGLYDFAPLPGQPGNAAIAGHRTTYGAPFGRLNELRPDDEIVVQTLQGTFTYRVHGHDDGNGGLVGHFIVPPNAVEVLDDQGDNRLTLTACHPEYSARERIIVTAGLVGEPRVPLPRPSQLQQSETAIAEPGSGDGAGGDPSTVPREDGDGSGVASEGDAAVQNDTVASSEQRIDAAGFGQGLAGDGGAVALAVLWASAAAAIWFSSWFVGRHWRRWAVYGLAALPFALVLFATFGYVDAALPAY